MMVTNTSVTAAKVNKIQVILTKQLGVRAVEIWIFASCRLLLLFRISCTGCLHIVSLHAVQVQENSSDRMDRIKAQLLKYPIHNQPLSASMMYKTSVEIHQAKIRLLYGNINHFSRNRHAVPPSLAKVDLVAVAAGIPPKERATSKY
jgi:hypothetical protein